MTKVDPKITATMPAAKAVAQCGPISLQHHIKAVESIALVLMRLAQGDEMIDPQAVKWIGFQLDSAGYRLREVLEAHPGAGGVIMDTLAITTTPSEFTQAVAKWRALVAAAEAADLVNDPALDEIDDARYNAWCEVEVARPVSMGEWLAKLDLMAVGHCDTAFAMVNFLDLVRHDLAGLGVEYTLSPEAAALRRGFSWGQVGAPSGAE